MNKLAQFISGSDINSFLTKEFNDSLKVIQQLGSDVDKLNSIVNNLFPVATYLPSALSLTQFQSKMGNGWVLANGQSVSDKSEYFRQTGKSVVLNMTSHVSGLNFYVRIN